MKAKVAAYCFAPLGACAILFGAVFALVGCEIGSDEGLSVSPSEITLAKTDESVALTVSYTGDSAPMGDLALPLEWSVHNSALGMITSSSDYDAVYSRFSPNGVNIVEVKDQYGANGVAVIEQVTKVTAPGTSTSTTTTTTTTTSAAGATTTTTTTTSTTTTTLPADG